MALNVYVANYETSDSTWKAYIVAESREDLTGYLKTRFGDNDPAFKINSIEQREEIHAFTTKVLDRIRGPKQEAEVVETTKLICPWCDSTDYETPHALKMHIVKQHAESKKKDKGK